MTEKSVARILIVDDENAIRCGLASALRRSGFDVLEAQDGEQALQSVDRHAPDLIVLDILMPGMDGREVCRRNGRTVPGFECA